MDSKKTLYTPPQDERELVLAWLRRARESQMAHYEMANILSDRERLLGVPVILLTSIIGTSAFASLTTEAIDPAIKIAVGALGVIAAFLASLQTFFKYSERSERHKACAARFAAVRRELEIVYAENSFSNERNYISTIREKLDRLAEESPHIPENVFEKVVRKIYEGQPAIESRQAA